MSYKWESPLKIFFNTKKKNSISLSFRIYRRIFKHSMPNRPDGWSRSCQLGLRTTTKRSRGRCSYDFRHWILARAQTSAAARNRDFLLVAKSWYAKSLGPLRCCSYFTSKLIENREKIKLSKKVKFIYISWKSVEDSRSAKRGVELIPRSVKRPVTIPDFK